MMPRRDDAPTPPTPGRRMVRALAGGAIGLVAGALIGAALGAFDFRVAGFLFFGDAMIDSMAVEALVGAIGGGAVGAVAGVVAGLRGADLGRLGSGIGLVYGVVPGAYQAGLRLQGLRRPGHPPRPWPDRLTLVLLLGGLAIGLLLGSVLDLIAFALLSVGRGRRP